MPGVTSCIESLQSQAITLWPQAYPSHSLSEAALSTSRAPIFVLDSYMSVLVYYTAAAAAPDSGLPFPPPQALHCTTPVRLSAFQILSPDANVNM